jgi:hypothetical protein
MFGIEDPGIYWAYILTVLSSLICIAYGIMYWNKGAIQQDDLKESEKWEREEDELNENL